MALLVRKKIEKQPFFGKAGRAGFVEGTLWGDLTQDQLVEIWLNARADSRAVHFTGFVDPNYESPFDKKVELPVKPETPAAKKARIKAEKEAQENTTK